MGEQESRAPQTPGKRFVWKQPYLFYEKKISKKKKLSHRVWDTNTSSLHGGNCLHSQRDSSGTQAAVMGNSGQPRRGPAGSGTCISHSSPLAFPQLPAGISWNAQSWPNLKSSKKLHKGRRWLWLFHLSRAGFGDGKWLFWHPGRINWLCRESHQPRRDWDSGPHLGVQPLLSPAPNSAFQILKHPQSWPCKGRDFEEPGVRSHFAALCLFHPYSTAQLSRRGWDTPIPKSCSLPDPGKSSPPSCPCGAAVTAPKAGHGYRNQAGKGKDTQSTKRSARLQFTLRGAERAPVPCTAPRIIQSCHIEISLCIYL